MLVGGAGATTKQLDPSLRCWLARTVAGFVLNATDMKAMLATVALCHSAVADAAGAGGGLIVSAITGDNAKTLLDQQAFADHGSGAAKDLSVWDVTPPVTASGWKIVGHAGVGGAAREGEPGAAKRSRQRGQAWSQRRQVAEAQRPCGVALLRVIRIPIRK